MKTDTWMPFYTGDYLKNTMHLSRAEHGSYVLLILAYWTNGGPLQDDGEAIRNIAKCPEGEWPRTKGLLMRLFTVSGGYWRHNRIDEELARASSLKAIQMARTEAATAARRCGHDKRNGQRNDKRNVDVTDNVTNVTDNVTTNVTVTPSPSHVQSPPPSAAVPSVDEVIEFGSKYPGDLARGVPGPIPKDFCVAYHEAKEKQQTWLNRDGLAIKWRLEVSGSRWWRDQWRTWRPNEGVNASDRAPQEKDFPDHQSYAVARMRHMGMV